MQDIQKEIQQELDTIEKQCNVRILLAVESGSRAWGFASPDSDYDVRFIYVQDRNAYLSIDEPKDVINWKLDEVLDINGWDLKKVLLAIAKSNPNLLEWLNSSIIYRRSEDLKLLKDLSVRYFSKKTAVCHYYGIANSTYYGYLQNDEVKYKKYFYALRPLLCCRWIERYDEMPPVKFSELMKLFDENDDALTNELHLAINDLLVKKAATKETDLNPQIPAIIDFISNECEYQKVVSSEMPDDHCRDHAALDDAFCKIIG